MRRNNLLKVYGLALCATVLFQACPSGDNNTGGGLGSDEFWASTTDNGSVYKVYADKMVEGESCIIYAERGAKITADVCEDAASEFDMKIHSTIVNNFGTYIDVDENGKVILLLLDIKDGNTGQIGGYFQPKHMVKGGEYSNGADMLFIDINPQKAGSKEFYSTMAHELVHLIHYSQTTGLKRPAKETWINEGLATAGEYLYAANGGSVKYRGDPNERIPYAIAVYQKLIANVSREMRVSSFFEWDSTIMDYSTAFLFFQWLRIHAKSGAGIYKKILSYDSPNHNCITESIKSSVSEEDSELEFSTAPLATLDPLATVWDWKTLLKAWYISNYYSDNTETSFFFNYGGSQLVTDAINYLNSLLVEDAPRITRIAGLFNSSGGIQDVSLRSSEGFLSQIGLAFTESDETGSGNSVNYTGLKNNKNIYLTTPFASGDVLLTLNCNTNHNMPLQTGKMPKGVYEPLAPSGSGEIGSGGSEGSGAGRLVTTSDQPKFLKPLPTPKTDVRFRPNGTLDK
ncbi:MAG: hypothetical protein LBC77_07100 [Spirochaetaceae bacterium]|jgi:hypothetical protein|nr:hypothetical protein [Spirochaetaceae bacterium]